MQYNTPKIGGQKPPKSNLSFGAKAPAKHKRLTKFLSYGLKAPGHAFGPLVPAQALLVLELQMCRGDVGGKAPPLHPEEGIRKVG